MARLGVKTFAVTLLVTVAAAACSSSDSPASGGTDAGSDLGASETGASETSASETGTGPGGAVAGAVDNHCGTKVQETSQASCDVKAPDGGMPPEEAPVMYNASADDDDCKYHLAFTSTPVAKSSDVFITVVATRKQDGKPAEGADVNIEAALPPIHPMPNSGAKTVEAPKGTYKIGPLRFDEAGRWTVRFHLYEDCTDVAEDTPHGHAAFYFDVP